MNRTRAKRRTFALIISLLIVAASIVVNPEFYGPPKQTLDAETNANGKNAMNILSLLEVKGRAPKTGYERDLFGDGWLNKGGCDTRNIILSRDLVNTIINTQCQVVSGILNDPYTGKTIVFRRGELSSQEVQIDHVVALSDAWQKGAQQLSERERLELANDPLELLAVDGDANQQKSDSDAASWLPSNRAFRCQYVARQIAVKYKYRLWVTQAEKQAFTRVLATCPTQQVPAQS